jgi:putative ABC transport system ATP-binding protein
MSDAIVSAPVQRKSVASVRNLTKVYHLGKHLDVPALRGVSLEFRQGDFVAIMGASGSGKSTLLNLLGCLDRPSAGQYVIAGNDVSQLDDEALSRIRSRYIGFIFQSYNLIPQLTVVENIKIPLGYQRRPVPDGDLRALRLARLVGLAERLEHRPSELSGGQQQRVAIARSLVNNPHIILADEPTGNLDSATGEEIMGLLNQLNRAGRTIIMVTHEADIAAHAQKIVRLRDGLIAEVTENRPHPPG